jgi:hypothetical protein
MAINEIGAESLELNDQCILFELAEGILAEAGNATMTEDTHIVGYDLPVIMPGEPTRDQPLTNIQDQSITAARARRYLGQGTTSVHESNYDYIKYISLRSPTRQFLEITPPEVAQLAPSIKIDVAYYDERGRFHHAVPMDFPNHTDLSGLLGSQSRRFGAGIKEISIIHEGIDSATAKIVLIDSVFVFQDFRTLAQTNYQNLISLGIRSTSNLLRYLRFRFGWDSSPGISGDLALPQLRSEVRGELVKYTFDFAEDGSIILKTQHRGHIHSMFGNLPAANVLGTTKTQESALRAASVKFLDDAMKKIRTQNVSNQEELAIKQMALSVVMDTLSEFSIINQTTFTAKTAFNNRDDVPDNWKVVANPSSTYHGIKTAVKAGLEHVTAGTPTRSAHTYVELIERPGLGFGAAAGFNAARGIAFWIDPEHLTTTAVDEALRRQLGSAYPSGADALDIADIREKALGFLRGARRSAQSGRTTQIGGNHPIHQAWNPRKSHAHGRSVAQWDQFMPADWYSDARLVSWDAYQDMWTHLQQNQKDLGIARDQTGQNLKPRMVLATARKQLAHKMGLSKFLSLFNLAKTLRDRQRIYLGAMTEMQAVAIAGAKTSAQALTNVFAQIHAREFLRNIIKIAPKAPGVTTEKAKEMLSTPMIDSVPFMFLGEFLSTILETPADLGPQPAGGPPNTMPMWELLREQAGIDLRVVLGYTDFETPYSGRVVRNFPLYYLPISLTKMNNFIAREIVGRDKTFYSFGEFLKDVINKFLDVHFHVCSKVANAGYTPATPKLDFAFGETPHDETIWFIYDSKQTGNVHQGPHWGRYNANMVAKIPHFYLGGPNKGIAKKVQIRDIADPSLKTAVFYKSSPSDTLDPGNAGPAQGRWAPVVFEAEVETLGYPKFQLGHMIFIDARTVISSQRARENFLATGYYGIKKITHTLTPDDFSTTVNAIIQVSERDNRQAQTTGRLTHNPEAAQTPVDTDNDVLVATATAPSPGHFPAPAPGSVHSVSAASAAEKLAKKAAEATSAQVKKNVKKIKATKDTDYRSPADSAP